LRTDQAKAAYLRHLEPVFLNSNSIKLNQCAAQEADTTTYPNKIPIYYIYAIQY